MEKANILVVEDEGIVAKDIQNQLQSLGYSVPGFTSIGKEAVQKAGELLPDLVLMDIKLKGSIDGINAARQIRDYFDIPVIFLTAYTDEDTLNRAKTTESYGYLVKPFVKKELYCSIEVAIYKHSLERKLKENNRWLSTILKSIGEAVIVTDSNYNIRFMNPAAEELTGWQFEEANEKNLFDVYNLVYDNSGKPIEYLKRMVPGESLEDVYGGEKNSGTLIMRNGARMDVDDSITPIKDSKGDMVGTVVIFRDISFKNYVIEMLQYQRNLLKTVIDFAPDMLVLKDLHSVYRAVNPAFCKYLGKSEDEIVGKTDFDLFPLDEAEIYREDDEEVMQTGKPLIKEEYKARAVGKGWYQAVKTPVFGDNGSPIGIICSIRNITGRRNGEEALRKSEERFHNFFEESTMGMAVLSTDSHFIKVNTRLCRMLGYKVQELTELNSRDITHPDDINPELQMVQRVLKGNIPHFNIEKRYIKKSGEVLWASVTASVIKDNSRNPIYITKMIEDITRRKQWEETLQQMSATVAHEVRNPLNTILSGINLLEWGKGNKNNILKGIRSEVKRMREIVTNFLRFSGTYTPKLSIGDLNLLLLETMSMLEGEERYRGVIFKKEFDSTIPLIFFDNDQIKQVLWNIILNALDAMPEGGVLKIRSVNYKDYVEFNVIDSGNGINDAVLDRIFQPFYTTKKEGTGLGLSIAEKIVKAHGGKIEVESEEGNGTKVKVVLPRKESSWEQVNGE